MGGRDTASALNAGMSVVFHQLSDGVDGGQIEVAFDAVFDCAGRGGQINQLVGVHPMNYPYIRAAQNASPAPTGSTV